MQNKFSEFICVGKSKKYIFCLFLSALIILPASASDTAGSTVKNKLPHSKFSKRKKINTINDLRIIVDISGSMKKTDPHNLRRSAIRLLAGLVPEGSRAGIWNFGKQVNMSVKIGTVNDAWRKLARAQSKKISSAGLYTNIESVMRKASFDWRKEDPRYKRNIIILTDGHVDISKDEKINKASRRRILKEVLPKFEKAKVRIHTIALSDDVDESLLSTLSAYTDGLYKKVHSADELQKLFLQMLEQSIKLDTLPLKDNVFNVDSSINDMTLLVFNKDKSSPTIVVTPENKKWKNSAHAGNVKWFRDEGYDLITIKKPQKGEWKIQAPMDPNNRVVVATNLKLKLKNIPSYLVLGTPLNITAHLEEDGKPLTDQSLLSKFKFSLERNAERSSERRYPLTRSDKDNFSYNLKLNAKFKEGNNELVIQAKSPTVERELRHQFKVYTTPANIKISKNQEKYKLEVEPHISMMRPKTIKINVVLEDKSKHILIQHDKNWVVDVDEKFSGSLLKINIDAIGADSKPIHMSFDKKLSVEGGIKKLDLSRKFEAQQKMEEKNKSDSEQNKPTQEKKSSEKSKESIEKKHESEVEHTEKKDIKSAEDEESNAEESHSVTFVIISVVIGNLLLGAILGGGYIFMKRRKEKMAENLSGELEDVGGKKEEAKEE